MKLTRFVPNILFGQNCFDDLNDFLPELFPDKKPYVVYIIDSIHEKTGLMNRLNLVSKDMLFEVDASSNEPKTTEVDSIRDAIVEQNGDLLPRVIVGIGGGSAMDVGKAVSILLTNPGSSVDYQGWDLVKQKGVPKIAVPTLAGTGAEVTRTAVLTAPDKKLGINSEFSLYDAVLLDPELLQTVNHEQEFYTGMDNYIHCVEALNGSAINALGKPFAEQAKGLTMDFFLKGKNYSDYMVSSLLGGCSITNSSVGICHALAYGIAFVLGYRHGISNAIVFNHLHEFYGDDVSIFQKMMKKNKVALPSGVTRCVTADQLETMIEMTYLLKRDLVSALGPHYKEILTPDKIARLYEKM